MKCLKLSDTGLNGVDTCINGKYCKKLIGSKYSCEKLNALDSTV